MKSKVLGEGHEKVYAVVFGTGEEAVAGLRMFASDRHLTASRFTAIGAFSEVVLGYFDWETKKYQSIPVNEQVEVLALVTKRLGAMTVAGQKVYQIGIPIHWGYVGLAADSDPTHGRYWMANALTPFVGDANARTPEFKAFLVNLEKM